MPIGILLNAGAVVVGSLIGATLGKKIHGSILTVLPTIFGMIALTLGVSLAVQVKYFPALTLSLIFGTIIGELLRIDGRLHPDVHRDPAARLFPVAVCAGHPDHAAGKCVHDGGLQGLRGDHHDVCRPADPGTEIDQGVELAAALAAGHADIQPLVAVCLILKRTTVLTCL